MIVRCQRINPVTSSLPGPHPVSFDELLLNVAASYFAHLVAGKVFEVVEIAGYFVASELFATVFFQAVGIQCCAFGEGDGGGDVF